MAKKILIVESDPTAREAFRIQLDSAEYEISGCDNFSQAEQLCRAIRHDTIVIGANFPREETFNLLPRLKSLQPEATIVLVPGSHAKIASEAVKILGPQFEVKPLHEIERRYIEEVLLLQGWRVQSAARKLGIPRSSLYHKIKQYGISRAGLGPH